MRIIEKKTVFYLMSFFWLLRMAAPCTVSAEDVFRANDAALPGIVLCEVNGYGENAVRQELYYSLRDLLLDKLYSSGKLRVEPRLTIEPVLPSGERVNLDRFFSQMHMDAIAHSPHFERGEANKLLRDYSASVVKRTSADGNVYSIGGTMKEKAKDIGAAHHAKYLFFCNLRDVDIYGTDGVALPSFHISDGIKMKVQLDYYLVNSENGKVFEGREAENKSVKSFSIAGLDVGRELTVENMFHKVLDKMAEKAVDTIVKKGMKAVEK